MVFAAFATRSDDRREGQLAVPLFEAVLQETVVGADTSVLDIGCGSGIFCEMAARRGAQVSGLDASEPHSGGNDYQKTLPTRDHRVANREN